MLGSPEGGTILELPTTAPRVVGRPVSCIGRPEFPLAYTARPSPPLKALIQARVLRDANSGATLVPPNTVRRCNQRRVARRI